MEYSDMISEGWLIPQEYRLMRISSGTSKTLQSRALTKNLGLNVTADSVKGVDSFQAPYVNPIKQPDAMVRLYSAALPSMT